MKKQLVLSLLVILAMSVILSSCDFLEFGGTDEVTSSTGAVEETIESTVESDGETTQEKEPDSEPTETTKQDIVTQDPQEVFDSGTQSESDNESWLGPY